MLLYLADLPTKTWAVLDHWDETQGGASFRERVMEMGLVPGTRLRVAHIAPFGGTLAIEARGTLLALRVDDARSILVRLEGGQA
jgi:ferrous iron transport protein A